MLSKFSGWLLDFFPGKFAAFSKLTSRNNYRFKVPYPRTSSRAQYAVDDKYGKLSNQIKYWFDLIPSFPVGFLTSSQAEFAVDDKHGKISNEIKYWFDSKFSSWLFDFFPSKFAAFSKPPSRNNHRFKVHYPRTQLRDKAQVKPRPCMQS